MSGFLIPPKQKQIAFRRDTNVGQKPVIQNKDNALAEGPPAIDFKPAFYPGQSYSANNLYEFAKQVTTNWFPPDNYSDSNVSGSLSINGQNVGNLDFKVLPSQTITEGNLPNVFTITEDSAAAGLFIKGNLSINPGVTLTPTKRKLFTVIYVSGDLTLLSPESKISMTQRGANHSGEGESRLFTQEVNIQVGPNTVIAANGGAGATGPNTTSGTANQGTSGSTNQSGLQTGGGGGGWNDYNPAS